MCDLAKSEEADPTEPAIRGFEYPREGIPVQSLEVEEMYFQPRLHTWSA